jgi:TolB protein
MALLPLLAVVAFGRDGAAAGTGPAGSVFFLAHRNGGWGVWRMPADGSAPPVAVRTGTTDTRDLVVSADGRRLARSDSRGKLWVGPVEAPLADRLALAREGAEQPAFDPAGTRLAVVLFRAVPRDDAELGLIELPLGHLRPLPPLEGLETSPSFSADGRSLLFSRHLEGSRRPVRERLWRLRLPDGAPQALTPDDGSDCFDAVENPAGTQLVYASNRLGGYDLWLSEPDGSQARPLTREPAYEAGPRFSPDGAWVVYERHEESGTALWRIRTDGTESRRLSPPGWRCRRPVWTNLW